MNKKRPAKDELSVEEIRKKIILEYKGGMKIEDIAVENQYHIKSVQRIVRNFLGKKSYKRRKGARRPKKLTQTVKMAIVNKIRSQPWLSCQKIASQLNNCVSAETIR